MLSRNLKEKEKRKGAAVERFSQSGKCVTFLVPSSLGLSIFNLYFLEYITHKDGVYAYLEWRINCVLLVVWLTKFSPLPQIGGRIS